MSPAKNLVLLFFLVLLSQTVFANEKLFKKGLLAYQLQDIENAVKYWKKAARQDNTSAMYSLGLLYHQGKFTDKDPKLAEKWYRKASKKGVIEAKFQLANMQAEKGNFEQAADWYTTAAKAGNLRAQYELALLYKDGKGVKKDIEKTVYWLTKAGNNGSAPAQFKLVLMYMKGDGVEKDNEKAFTWAKLSSASGDSGSKYILGYMYYSGTGTVQSDEMATIWLEEALAEGQTKAQELLDAIEKRAKK